MKMLTYWTSLNTRARLALAEQLNTSPAYLSQIAYKHRAAGHDMAKRIEAVTNGVVTRHDLRPDIYGDGAA